MTQNRNIYKAIWEYILKHTKTSGEPDFLKKNKEKIANVLETVKPNNLNDIEVTIEDWNEWEVDMFVTEALIHSIIEKIQTNVEIKSQITKDIEKLTTIHIQTVLKDIINDLKTEIWNEIENNTNEIKWITITTYIKKYSDWYSKEIITGSAENFLDYIETKHTTYQAIEDILLAQCDNKALWDNIKEYLYEDIWMYWEKMLYNIASEHIPWKEIYKIIFDTIEKNIFNTKIIHYILEDSHSITWIKKRSKYAKNYIKYNYKYIIKDIEGNTWNRYRLINKYSYNQEIQKFIIENMDTIHNLIVKMGTKSIVKNINLLNNLFDTIIDDKFAINLQQLKQSKSYPTN